MKPVTKYLIVGALLLCTGAEISAQEKNKKKKQDSTYVQNKSRADEQRNREAEEKRKSDSIRVADHRDSIAQILRNDSIKYDRAHRDSLYNIDRQRKQDSIDRSQPPKKSKKSPPKNSTQCVADKRNADLDVRSVLVL